MTISEAISQTRKLSGNAVDDNTMCRWLSELDGRLMLDFYKGGEWMSYSLPDDEDHELLVPFPWDELYVHYLEAMVYYSNGEFERYRNSYEMYNKKELDFRQWYARTHVPITLDMLQKRDCTVVMEPQDQRCSRPFWYLSAYGIAVRHGYQGSVDEWLAELVGPPGPQGPAGADGQDATINGVNALTLQTANGISSYQSGSTLTIKLPDGGNVDDVLQRTATGAKWSPAPSGLPEGGTEGQVLTKTEAGQEWQDAPDGLPEGGTDGQILTKTADGVAWEDAPEGGVTSFNSRTGAITPQTGDYTAEMVGAVSEADVGVANGVAELDSTGKVPASQLPSMDYIPTSEKGANSGVATLDASGKLTAAQKPTYTADEVGARPDTWTPSAADVGAVPTTRTINSKPLSSDVTLTAEDVGAGEPATSATVTLTAAGWTGSAAPFSQQVSCSIVAADTAVVAVDVDTPGTDADADAEAINAWALCTQQNPTQGAGTLTFYCTEKPTINIPVKVGVA